MAVHHLDISNRTFGRYQVIAKTERRSTRGHFFWLCRCSCGEEREVRGDALRSGDSQSCGCLNLEQKQAAGRHRMSRTTEYKTWQGMKSRCFLESDPNYHRYGGRGIMVCDAWRESFDQFFADMGPKPTRRHSIDRIDNNGPYTPNNCRWALPKKQARNKRSNHVLSHQGQTKTLIEWAELLGMRERALSMRLLKGWTVERALTTPIQKRASQSQKTS